jgi:hypothetical protein
MRYSDANSKTKPRMSKIYMKDIPVREKIKVQTVVVIKHHNQQQHKTRTLQDVATTSDHQQELHTRPERSRNTSRRRGLTIEP